MLQLQRQAGNRATAALLGGPDATVQRQATGLDPAEQREAFEAARGEALVGNIRAALPSWQIYRRKPNSGDSATVSALDTVRSALAGYERERWPEAWMQSYARSRLGHEYLLYLAEMRSLFPGLVPAKIADLFGVAYRPVQHTYQLTMAGSTSLLDTVVGSIVPKVAISYTSSLGWGWRTELQLVGAQLGVSVGWEAGFGLEGPSPQERADAILAEPRPWWWPIGSPFSRPHRPQIRFQRPTKLPKAGAGFGPISIALQGTATARTLHLWGPDDVTGLIRYVEGPGLSADSPLGNATAHLGGLLEFVNGWDPAPLGFILAADYDVSAQPKPKAKVSVGANLLSMALGYAVAAGDPSFDQPAVGPPALLDAQRHWQLSVGPFTTGGADARPFVDEVDQLLAVVLTDLNASEQHTALANAGVDPQANYTLDVEVVGLASRRWAGAGSEQDRLLNNTALAMARADAVADLLRERAGGTPLRVTTSAGQEGQPGGPGAAVLLNPDQEGPGRYVILSDEQAAEELENRRARLDTQLARGEIDREEHQAETTWAAYELSDRSDPSAARRAMIVVSWRGKQVQLGQTGP